MGKKSFVFVIFLLLFVGIGCGKKNKETKIDDVVAIDSSNATASDLVSNLKTPKLDFIENVEHSNGSKKYTCTYEDVQHDFLLYLPEKNVEGAPLVIMLPGYGSTAEAFNSVVKFEKEARKRGYAVAYVTGASDGDGRTISINWNSGIGNSDRNDVGFLVGVVKYLQNKYRLSEKYVYAVGYSNGGFMTYRLAEEADDTFLAVVSVGGKMPEKIWDNRSDRPDISVFQINGTKDDVVPMDLNGSSKYAKDPSMESVINYFAKSNGLDNIEEVALSKRATLRKYSSVSGNNLVWQVLIQDGRHSWPDESITGFKVNEVILDYFDSVHEKNK